MQNKCNKLPSAFYKTNKKSEGELLFVTMLNNYLLVDRPVKNVGPMVRVKY